MNDTLHGPKEATLIDVAEATDIDGKGMALVGALLQASARSTATTMDRLLEAKDDEIRELAKTVTLMAKIVDEAMVMDRITQERFAMLDGRIWTAERTLDRMESSL